MKTCLIFAAFGMSVWAQFSPAPATPKSTANPEIAVVDGHSVTLNDVRQMLDTAPPQFLQFFKQNPQQAIQELQRVIAAALAPAVIRAITGRFSAPLATRLVIELVAG